MSLYDWGVHRSNRNAVCGSVYAGAVSLLITNRNSLERDDGYEFVFIGGGEYSKNESRYSYNTHYNNKNLSKSNLALAITCNAPLNADTGTKAHDWRKSRPVRVCRSSTIDNNMFAPKQGIRYDGLYKLVKYWPLSSKLVIS